MAFDSAVHASAASDPLVAAGFVIEVFVLLACAWLIVGNRYFFEGDAMERPANRIAQLYGYAVCLIAVVLFLVMVRDIASALITASDPLEAQEPYTPSLTSFEAYKATLNQPNAAFVTDGGTLPAKAQSDAELRQRYEALRSERLASTLYQTKSSIVLDGLMLVIAIVLFVLHWRWLRTLARA